MSLDQRLRDVFASVFGVDGAALADDASPRSIPAWDSVAHINLILSLEAEFGVQFDPAEIAELTSFGLVRERLARDGAGG